MKDMSNDIFIKITKRQNLKFMVGFEVYFYINILLFHIFNLRIVGLKCFMKVRSAEQLGTIKSIRSCERSTSEIVGVNMTMKLGI